MLEKILLDNDILIDFVGKCIFICGVQSKTQPQKQEWILIEGLIERNHGIYTNYEIAQDIWGDKDRQDASTRYDSIKNKVSRLNKRLFPRKMIDRVGEGYKISAGVAIQNLGKQEVTPIADLSHEACVLQDMNILVKPRFVEEARKDTFDQLDEAFQKSRVAFLVGCGGIGKSEACKHWAIQKKQAGDYETVIFAQLNSDEGNSNVLSLITDDSIFVLTEGFAPRYERESDEAYFTRKLNKIKQVADAKTLLIIDNYDKEDPRMRELLQGTYNLLVTTRTMPEEYAFPIILVEEIRELDHLKKIFFGYLGGERSNIQWDDPYIEKLFDLVSNHTLAIEIIARALRFSEDTPKELYQKMSNPIDHTLIRNVDGTINRRTPFEIIQMLFSLSSLKNDEDYRWISQVLSFMAAMPTRGIDLDIMNGWSTGPIRRARHTLVQKSWLREEIVNGVKYISMHPLIKEVVWDELQPNPEKFPEIAEKLVQENGAYVDGLYHQPKNVKDQYEKIALSLLSSFPVRDLDQFAFYIKLQRTLHICANAEFALSLAEQIKGLLEKNSQQNTWRYGYIHYRLGTIYSSLLRQRDRAMEYYERAVEIMERTAQSDEEKFWLTLLYREIGSAKCQDRYLLKSQDLNYTVDIEAYFNKGEKLAAELTENGFAAKNLEIYRGTLCVWRSKLAAHLGDYALAVHLLEEAEREFMNFSYTNVVDKAAVADVRALICAKNGQYAKEVEFLKEANEAFRNGFGEYHYAYVERALKLAIAHENDGQHLEAIIILKRCKKILEDMIQNNAALVNETLVDETEALLEDMEAPTLKTPLAP